MYNHARLEIYHSLTISNGEDPALRLAITSDEIINWTVSPVQGAADNMFEIYGRTCRVSLLRRGEFKQIISTKEVNTQYPDYYNAAFRLINETTGEPIFTGALPVQNINHNYDSGLIEIVLVDALHILVMQSRRHSHGFEESIELKQWHFLNNGFNDIIKIFNSCLSNLAIGLGQYTITDGDPLLIAGFPLYVENMPFDMQSYREEGVRITTEETGAPPQIDYPLEDWVILQPFVHYDADTDKFHILMLYAWRHLVIEGQDIRTHYRCFWYRAVFERGNILLPLTVERGATTLSYDPITFRLKISNIISPLGGVVNQSITDENWIRFSGAPMNAGITVDGYVYAMGVQAIDGGYQIITRTPIKFNTLYFKADSITYDDILYAMLSGNALHIRATESGLILITPSIIKAGREIALGYPINDEYIIDQRRIGALANPETLSRSFSSIENGGNIGRALMRVFTPILNSLACKLSFYLPQSFYTDENIELFEAIHIDGHDYIITQISYPENGLIKIECVGAWN